MVCSFDIHLSHPFSLLNILNNANKKAIAGGESYYGPDTEVCCSVGSSLLFRPESHGIDVALLYQPMTFRCISHHPLRVDPLPSMRPTRDILYVKGETLYGDLHVYVVHAPSRSGGEKLTRPHRMAVMTRLLSSIDSLCCVETSPRIIVMGDFNDYSADKSLRRLSASCCSIPALTAGI